MRGKKYFFPLCVGMIGIQRLVSLLIHLPVDGDDFGVGLKVPVCVVSATAAGE